ncbi:alpha/beta hydrolase [Empedobacter falsenii]|uniref:alpha/beta hydrolase family protein n=1 Tax=Empedobacter falsenii TaxID=343874 RepID=UPI0025752979|nr:alpha/beta hydrolase [Empedobacter falsenii]MDM1298403.1 alpha/beta hydrolase [Empedobacter falsenii]MDM1318040.1 alpha/beta hydrolase [Empedobacter falsenii]
MKKILFVFILICSTVFGQSTNNFTESDIQLNENQFKLFGTLCLPQNEKSKIPIVLLISGSGPTDRNGNNNMMINNSLKYLAHSLAEKGIGSIRYDKRGIGESSIANLDESKLTFDDYVEDASNWVTFIKKDKRFNSISIAGHSEGSLIGMLASTKNVDKFISISGAGEPIDQILKKQLNQLPEQLKTESYVIVDSLKNGNTVNNINPNLSALFRKSVQPYLISWIKYNPVNEINKLTIPFLVIQGDMDIQVDTENAKNLSPKSAVIIKEMNHILKNITSKDDLSSYNNPELPINTELVEVISNFILKK